MIFEEKLEHTAYMEIKETRNFTPRNLFFNSGIFKKTTQETKNILPLKPKSTHQQTHQGGKAP